MSASKNIQDIANMISEDNPNIINESRFPKITQRWSEHGADLTPYLRQKEFGNSLVSNLENPLDDIRDEFGGYDVEYIYTASKVPEEPQTYDYPGFPAHTEIDNIEIDKITKAGKEVLMKSGGRSTPYNKHFTDAAEEYFWDHIADTSAFQEAMADEFYSTETQEPPMPWDA